MLRFRLLPLLTLDAVIATGLAAQAPKVPPAERAQAGLRRAAAASEALVQAMPRLEAFQAGIERLAGLESLKGLEGLAGFEGLQGLEGLAGLERLQGLEGLEGLVGLEGLGVGLGWFAWPDPPSRSWPQDQGDSLYRAARQALNSGRYQQAAEMFERTRERYPRSAYAGDALYWAAFARYRLGGSSNLQAGLRLVSLQSERYPDARTRRDAEVLATRINGELARLGNAEAAESISVRAAPPAPPSPPAPGAPALAPTPPGARGQASGCGRDEDNELRLAALNALLQMDSERAIPILKQVAQRRDACSVELRRKAMFLLSQKRGEEVTDVLLDAARTDPDREVRAQAIFWLSQVGTERAVTALDSVLLSSTDQEIQEKAIFAVSQHNNPRAGEILRSLIDRPNMSDEVKAKAIFWLGQRHSGENLKYLQDIYPRLKSEELREKVIFSISQVHGADSQRWLMDIALNQNETMEMRKKALFWAGQSHEVAIADLTKLYDTMSDREMREQLIFVYSQRREPEAIDKLMAIAEKDPDGELRKKALFWLGQSKDPRVAEFLLRIINK